MSFTNSCEPSREPELLRGYYGPDPYDINWAFPLHEATLESERVKLTPFIPSTHAEEYMKQYNEHPNLHRWIPLDLRSTDHLLTTVEVMVRRQPGWLLFAIHDKTRGGAYAGVIGLVQASAHTLSVEIGWVLVFPAFQRTHVAPNAVGLLLQYCLEVPDAARPGLGMRRVQWTANTRNMPSIGAAKRMGFKEEGTMRWSWVLPEGKEGNGIPIRQGDPRRLNPGRDSTILSVCADDWENGGREHVQQVIDRP
ncbi:acyl-CoA N-acyltransferase [Gloeopeniophorella convolvens]|nr:acyl-CoA N-acyltransferase [Gloeopeniophorella convolvens]